MIKRTIFILFNVLLIIALPVSAQPDAPILSKEQNQKWLWDLEVLTLKEQVAKIQKRIIADSNFYMTKEKVMLRDGYVGSLQPLYMIDNVPLTICKGTGKEALSQLVELLNTVVSVKVLQDAQASSLVGRRGESGYIVMQTNSSKTEEKLQKLNLTGSNCQE